MASSHIQCALLYAAGKTLRTFAGPVDDYAVGSAAGAGGAVNWPLFKWAGGGEDKCARCAAAANPTVTVSISQSTQPQM